MNRIEPENNGDRAASIGGGSRREFLRNSGLAAGGALLLSAAPRHRAFGATPIGANDRIGIGLIGCGGRGNHLVEKLAELRDGGQKLEIVAVCDAYRPRMMKTAERYGAKSTMDYRELLEMPEVDAVVVATPDHLHGRQAIDALGRGKHVYCEKPITHWRQFEIAKELAQTARDSNCTVQVGAQGMSDSAWRQMRAMVEQGMIGQPIHAECGYFRVGDWGERGMPIDDPDAQPGPDLNWKAFLGDSPDRPFDVSRYFRWRMYEDYSGGPATDLFPHSLSPVVHVLGVGFPSTVVATGGKFRYDEREVPDTFNVLIDYPEKITVAVLGTQGNDYPGQSGSRGAPGRVPVIRGWEGALTVEGENIVLIPTREAKKEPQSFPIEYSGDIKPHLDNFLECIRTGAAPYHGMDLAYHVQTALMMGVLAHRSGTAARFDPSQETIRV